MRRPGMAMAAVMVLAACQPPAAAPAPTPSRTKAAVPQVPGKAVLDSGGVTFDGKPGKSGEFPFGAAREVVDGAARSALGQEGVRTALAECGAGPMKFSTYGPLVLNFLDDEFVGWRAEAGPQVVTADGIRPGSMLRDLKVARSARMIEDSTLEGEFEYIAADGRTIGGFVTGTGKDARIASLHAGVSCFFR
jgi:hypothetical protein